MDLQTLNLELFNSFISSVGFRKTLNWLKVMYVYYLLLPPIAPTLMIIAPVYAGNTTFGKLMKG
jgi:hypothetical protein